MGPLPALTGPLRRASQMLARSPEQVLAWRRGAGSVSRSRGSGGERRPLETGAHRKVRVARGRCLAGRACRLPPRSGTRTGGTRRPAPRRLRGQRARHPRLRCRVPEACLSRRTASRSNSHSIRVLALDTVGTAREYTIFSAARQIPAVVVALKTAQGWTTISLALAHPEREVLSFGLFERPEPQRYLEFVPEPVRRRVTFCARARGRRAVNRSAGRPALCRHPARAGRPDPRGCGVAAGAP
jgi:hypothetical protein